MTAGQVQAAGCLLLVAMQLAAFAAGEGADAAVANAVTNANLAVHLDLVRSFRERNPKPGDQTTYLRERQARWTDAVKLLLERKLLAPGMDKAKLAEILGPPQREEGGEMVWYFNSPMHVNPGLRCTLAGSAVASIRMTRY